MIKTYPRTDAELNADLLANALPLWPSYKAVCTAHAVKRGKDQPLIMQEIAKQDYERTLARGMEYAGAYATNVYGVSVTIGAK